MGSLKLLTFEFYLFLNCFMHLNDIAHNDNAILFSLCVLVLNIDQGITMRLTSGGDPGESR